MTLHSLEQYGKLQKEIKILEERIEKYKAQENEIVADTVKDYRDGERIIIIRGYSAGIAEKTEKVRLILEERKERLAAKYEEIERFIDSIDDSVLRLIIELHYVDGFDWTKVAYRVYGKLNESTPRMKVTRYFENK